MDLLCLFVGILIGIGIASVLRYRASPQQSIADVLSDMELLINELKISTERQLKRVTFAVTEQKDNNARDATEQKENDVCDANEQKENDVCDATEQKDNNARDASTENSNSPVSLTEFANDITPITLRGRLADAISQIKQRKKISLDSAEKSDIESVN